MCVFRRYCSRIFVGGSLVAARPTSEDWEITTVELKNMLLPSVFPGFHSRQAQKNLLIGHDHREVCRNVIHSRPPNFFVASGA